MTQVSRCSSVFAASVAMSLAAACGGVSDTDGTSGSTGSEVGSATQALTNCQVNSDLTAFCAPTAVKTLAFMQGTQPRSRSVYYRIGATTGPGYNPATGAHSAVMLFQGTSSDGNDMTVPDDLGGGLNGPRGTWSTNVPLPGDFGAGLQVSTVIALVDAGYTVIQPAAYRRCATIKGALQCFYAWDTNLGAWGTERNPGLDLSLTNALILELSPGKTTFGTIDIDHVYATGISSGGYMSSRMANEFASGLNGNGTVKDRSKPVRAVAIDAASFQTCSVACPVVIDTADTHAPTFLLYDRNDMVVPIRTVDRYIARLKASPFTNGNVNYTVNGVQEVFLKESSYNGTAPPLPPKHHQWDPALMADGTNSILGWFNSHH